MPLANDQSLGSSSHISHALSNGAPLKERAVDSIGDRIEFLRRRIEPVLSQAELARRAKMKQSTLSSLIRNGGSTTFLPQLARELATTTAFLQGDTDDPSEGAIPRPTAETVAEQLDAVLVPYLHNFEHSMGDGAYFDDLATTEMIPISRDWLAGRMQGSAADLVLLSGRGDSMQPTIRDGDVLLVDRAQRSLREPDRIWAFGYAESGYVKRLRRLPGGQVEVNSDNPAVRSWTTAADDLHVVGRVINIMQWH